MPICQNEKLEQNQASDKTRQVTEFVTMTFCGTDNATFCHFWWEKTRNLANTGTKYE